MEIDSNGKLISHDIFESVIRSRIQMTYKKVNQILEQNEIPNGYEEYVDKLKEMKKLADIVRQNKIKRGYIDFDIDEAKIIVDSEGNVLDIEKRYRGSGEKMIEDFMILANEAVAETITNLGLTGIYRIHGDVSIERLRKFLKILRNYHIRIKDDFKFVNQKTIQNILKEIKDLEGFQILATRMISCMDKARYSTNNIGHFALASRNYTHFTSPIRRFPDTTVHRLLRTYLFKHDMSRDTIGYYKEHLPMLGEHTSYKERCAIECEREVDDMKKAEYMEDHIGETFEGIVSTVTSFGMFIELPNLIEGLVKLDTFQGEKYYFDEEMFAIVSEHDKRGYRLGDTVKVKLIAASKEARTIDFEVVKDGNTK
jgi:ribonuclease R